MMVRIHSPNTVSVRGILFCAALFLLVFPSPLFATSHPTGLVPCENAYFRDTTTGNAGVRNPCDACQVFKLSENILNFIYIDLTIPLAALMLLWGGFLMISSAMSGNPGAAERGKKILRNTIIGICIIFFAWIGIDAIIKLLLNKDITESSAAELFRTGFGPWNKIECETREITFVAPPSGPPDVPPPPLPDQPPISPTPHLDNTTARGRILGAGMQITSTGGCSDQNNPNCTSMQGLPEVAVNELINLNSALRSSCPTCNLTISGGTETGHRTHGSGKSVVDISSGDSRVNQFIRNAIGTANPRLNTWYRGGANNYYFYEGDHWHVCLSSSCAPHRVENDQIRGL